MKTTLCDVCEKPIGANYATYRASGCWWWHIWRPNWWHRLDVCVFCWEKFKQFVAQTKGVL